jgi:hypothetical protein
MSFSTLTIPVIIHFRAYIGKISVIYQQNIAKISVNYRQFIRGFVLFSCRKKNREGYYETSEIIRSVAGG